MRRRVACSAACFLMVLPLFGAAAQQPRSGTIAGIVRRSLDSLPVASASITLDDGATSAMSDSAGGFVLHDVPAGAHTLTARRVGYLPTTATALVVADSTIRLVLYAQSTAQQLTTVEVAGKKVQVPTRFAGIAERANRNHGVLFTAQDIDPETRTKDVLQRLPGVQVNDRSVTFARCQDSGQLPGAFGGVPKQMARVQVYVDGLRQTGNDRGDANEVLNSINPASIELMEVYTGLSRIPSEYLEDACAVIAIWTKAY